MLTTKHQMKQKILDETLQAKRRNEKAIATLKDRVSVAEYEALTREGAQGRIWTDALQRALDEHEIVVIPPSAEVYRLDRTGSIPSDRRIEAVGEVIR